MSDETTDVGHGDVSEADAQNLLADAVEEMLGDEGGSPKSYDEGYVKKLRDENANRRVREQEARTQLETLQAQLKEYEDAKLTEAEKMQRELEELRTKSTSESTRAREAELSYQVALNASTYGIGDVKAAIKLMDRESLQFDDRGRISNLQDALETLKTEYPSLNVAAQRQVSAPNTGVTNPSKPTATKRYTRADLKGMSPQKVSELRASGELNHLLRGETN